MDGLRALPLRRAGATDAAVQGGAAAQGHAVGGGRGIEWPGGSADSFG